MPAASGKKVVLKLMFGAVIRAAERWLAIRASEFERRQMRAIIEELDYEYECRNGLDNKTSAHLRQIKIGIDRFSTNHKYIRSVVWGVSPH